MKPSGRVMLGNWLPDLPFYENPGLVEAHNAIPVDGAYKDHMPPVTSGTALAARCYGAASATDTTGAPYLYAGTATKLYVKNGSSWTDKSGAATFTLTSSDYWRFAQFKNDIIATNRRDNPKRLTVGSGSNFVDCASTGSAPKARHIGVIGDFVLLGDIDDGTAYPYAVQWCAIGDHTDWPTPLSVDAATKQSGRQYLKPEHGAVTGIVGGQSSGLVFQQRAITRFTYVGGAAVFQVQTFDRDRGCWAPGTLVSAGGNSYFFANDGFYATDGSQVRPIGMGKVDKWAVARMDQGHLDRFCAGVDYTNKVVTWAFPSAGGDGNPDTLLFYSFAEDRWGWADSGDIELLFAALSTGYTLDQLDALMTSIDDYSITLDSPIFSGGVPVVQVFGTDHKLGSFGGTPGTATFETGEMEPVPGGLVTAMSARPLVTGDPDEIRISVGTRYSQDNEGRTFSSPVVPNARTRNCDFRDTGAYVSARLEIDGNFDRALGLQYEFVGAGS